METDKINLSKNKNEASESDIAVTVFSLSYNHEKYIRRTLESFVTQKTSFKYEVLIHDDASTDKSADVIKEYHSSHPQIIRPIYQKENLYQSGGFEAIIQLLLSHARGKYIAVCECDDYWCDDNKLQMQYDAMETNHDAAICTHIVRLISENGMPYNRDPLQKSGLKRTEKLSQSGCADIIFARGCYFQTSSYFVKKNILLSSEMAALCKYLNGDGAIFYTALRYGAVLYIHKAMSCYRINSPGSWSSRHAEKSDSERAAHCFKYCDGLLLFDKQSGGVYRSQIMQSVFSTLFSLVIKYGQYKAVKKYIVCNAIKHKPKRVISLNRYTKCIALIYAPWMCRITGVFYRAYTTVRRGRM